MIDLETRLAELGELLAVTDADLSGDVLAALRPPGHTAHGRRRTLVAASVIVAIAVAGVFAWPGARHRVEGWLGLDRVQVVRDGVGAPPTTAEVGADDPLADRIVTVDGVTVVLGVIDGRLDDVFITKSVAAGGDMAALAIDGMPAIWVGVAHDVMLERDGSVVIARVADRTLLWQDGEVLRRVEGFRSLDDAVAYVRSR